MDWFCLFLFVLLVTGIVLAVRRPKESSLLMRLDSLEKQSQTQAELIKQLQLSNPSAEAEPLPAKAEPEATSVPPVLGALPAPAEGVDPLPTIEPEPQPKESPVLEEPKPLPAIGSAPSAPTTRQGKSQPWKPLPVLPEIEPEPVPDAISEPEPVPEVATTATEPEPKTKSSFELQIGKVWLVRLGVVLVLTGLVHLARMGYEGITDEVRPYVNASLLYLVSFGMMAAGLFLHRRFEVLKNYSEVLTGGGMAAVYFSTYALYFVERPYLGLIESPVLAGVLLIAWAAFIITLATRRQSEVMAMFAIAGAYFASYIPLIHDSDGDHAIFTLFSNVALAIAATVFVIRNRWANVSFLSLFTTFAGFAYWRFVHPAGSGAEFWQGAGFLTAYWIIFTLAGFLSRHEQMTATQRSAFINLNNGAFFGLITITLLQTPALREQYWIFPLVLSAALAGLHKLARRQLPDEPLLADVLLAKAGLLLTLAIMTLHQAEHFRALLLGAESVMIVFFGLRSGQRLLQWAGLGAAFAAVVFGGWELAKSFSELNGGFSADMIQLGGFLSVLLLAGGWVTRRFEPAREKIDPLVHMPDVYVLLGLGVGYAACLMNLPKEFPIANVLTLGTVGLAALFLSGPMRIKALIGGAQVYLITAMGLWFVHAFQKSEPAPGWAFALMLGIALLAQQWHQRYRDEDAANIAGETLIRHFLQGAYSIGLLLIASVWILRGLDFELAHASYCAAGLGLAFVGGGLALRSAQLLSAGQLALGGAAAMVVPQILLPGNELTWALALIAPVILLANAAALDRLRDELEQRLDLSVALCKTISAIAQATAVLVGLAVAIKFASPQQCLWMLPVIGIALSAGALAARMTPALIAAQAWLFLAALLSMTKIAAKEEMVLALIPGLAILGMSHFMLHARTLIDDQQSPLAKLAKANTSMYFLFGWLLALAWGYSFVPHEYLFITYTAVAIGHAVAWSRRARFERILVGTAFGLLGWLMYWWQCTTEWNHPIALDGLTFALLLAAQHFARKRDAKNIIPEAIHALVIVAMNLSLWVWASRMVPGDFDIITWGLLSGILICLGLYAAERAHRIFGLVIMLASTANLVFLAWSKLDGVERILTFIGLGVILIVLSGLYHKYQEQLKEYL
jgi:hypothetical protein